MSDPRDRRLAHEGEVARVDGLLCRDQDPDHRGGIDGGREEARHRPGCDPLQGYQIGRPARPRADALAAQVAQRLELAQHGVDVTGSRGCSQRRSPIQRAARAVGRARAPSLWPAVASPRGRAGPPSAQPRQVGGAPPRGSSAASSFSAGSTTRRRPRHDRACVRAELGGSPGGARALRTTRCARRACSGGRRSPRRSCGRGPPAARRR